MPTRRAPRRNTDVVGQITIERNVPIPDGLTPTSRARYPLHTLKPGQSFSFQAGSNPTAQLNAVKAATFYHRSRNPEKRFVAAIQGNVIRCWRLRDEPTSKQ